MLLEIMKACVVALSVSRLNGAVAIVATILETGAFVLGAIFQPVHGEWLPSDRDRTLLCGTSSVTPLAARVTCERVPGRPIVRSLAGLPDGSYSLVLSHVPIIAAGGLVRRHLLHAHCLRLTPLRCQQRLLLLCSQVLRASPD